MIETLKDRTALVTGAASGIGRAIARRFAHEGATVVCVDLAEAGLRATVEAIRAAGGEAMSFRADVRSESELDEVVAAAHRRYGAIDTVIANAGIHIPGTALDTSVVDWGQILAVNLTGAWLTSRVALQGMIEQQHGVVIFVSSIAGVIGVPTTAAYSAAKGGLIALTRQMASDFARDGVRVNAICPGGVDTPLSMGSRQSADASVTDSAARRRTEQLYPLGRIGTPEEIAGLARYLASDEASWITGATFVIDGGRSAS